MAKAFYLRVPIPGRDGYEYVRVDPERISSEVITQLWIRERSRDGAARYLPVIGAHDHGQMALDLGPLKATLNEVLPSYRPGFESLGRIGEDVFDRLLGRLDINRFLEAIERGEIQQATREWEGLLHSLLAGSLSVANDLQIREQHASGVTAGFEQIASTLEDNEAARLKLYEGVVTGSHQLIDATSQLEEIERQLGVLGQEVDTHIQAWQMKLSASSDPFGSAQIFFEGSADTTGFNLQAFRFVKNSEGSAQEAPDLVLAQLHVEECQGALVSVTQEWEVLRECVEQQVIPVRATVERLCDDLAKGSRAIREYRKVFGSAHRPPFELDSFREKITPEQFAQAARLADDHRWGPASTKSRLEGLSARIMARMEKPELPSQLGRMLEQAHRFISQVKHTEEPAIVVSFENEEGVSPIPTNPSRAQELYEMVKCVGLAITANPYYLAASTTFAMLDVLRFMGRITPEELDAYKKPVWKLSRRTGETARVDKTNQVMPMRKTSKATWIVYKTRGMARLKMTNAGAHRTHALLARYQLTVEALQGGAEGRRAEQIELYQNRKVPEET